MTDRFQKRSKCEYCEEPMDASRRSKRFCSTKCRVYFSRDKNTSPTEIKIASEPPKPIIEAPVVITIEKLRQMCPPELIGLDRTMWIQAERDKYGL